MIVTWPPFIRAEIDTRRLYLRKTVSLLPLAAGAVHGFGLEYLARLALMILGWLLFCFLPGRKHIGRTWSLSLYDTLFLSLLIPRELPWHLAWIGSALVALPRWLLGKNDDLPPFNWPVAISAAFLIHFGTGVVSWESSSAPAWLGPTQGQYFLCGILPPWISVLLLLILWNRYLKFRLWLGFMVPILILSGLWWYNANILPNGLLPFHAVSIATAVTAILLSDEASTPRAGWAQAASGFIAAVLFILFHIRGMPYMAVVWAVLVPSLFTPWLDAVSAYRQSLPRFME